MTSYILLGSNMGDSRDKLREARELIGRDAGSIKKISSLYKTAAWGNTSQNDFYNQVIEIETSLEPHVLLLKLLSIEKQMGRERKEKWEPRMIDLDILFYDSQVVEDDQLTIPHPFLHKRRFTLIPLVEICPDFVHPLLQMNMRELLDICEDHLDVEKL